MSIAAKFEVQMDRHEAKYLIPVSLRDAWNRAPARRPDC